MIAMLLDFKSSVYGLARAYFEFWYWAGFWTGFIGHWAGFVTQTWQPWLYATPLIAWGCCEYGGSRKDAFSPTSGSCVSQACCKWRQLSGAALFPSAVRQGEMWIDAPHSRWRRTVLAGCEKSLNLWILEYCGCDISFGGHSRVQRRVTSRTNARRSHKTTYKTEQQIRGGR